MRIKITLIVIVLFLLTACAKYVSEHHLAIHANEATVIDTYTVTAVVTDDSEPKNNMGEIYRLALDAFIPLWDGITNDLKYIAIDTGNLNDITDGDLNKILRHFERYSVGVMQASLEDLEKDGLLLNGRARYTEGILLRVKSTEIAENKVVIEGSLYKSAKAAIGTKVVIEFINGKWKVTEATDTWIS
ncbi:hypothetical protein MO973_03155 [Paenibacillus sp. TRM 82003]|nr:hypothetical protein [Paenibacillus sp. TRM 82003]